ncbi:MAG: protein-disulfide reductase DsbD N-terminal domain-containing protein [Paramuribaculum sp.]|nr:protein-disulfide reductase DsbD N-terminal domain-containing protein [Paramuribaculum sp.]
MRRIIFLIFITFCAVFPAFSQNPDPIRWQVTVKMTSATEGTAVFKARITPGWHLYGLKLPQGGPKATVIDASASTGIKFRGELKADRQPLKVHDSMFDLDLTWWDADIAFRRSFKVTDPANARIAGTINYMGCNDQTCSPPKSQTFDKKITLK